MADDIWDRVLCHRDDGNRYGAIRFIALGNCAISGGPFNVKENYNVIEGVDKLIDVDVYVPGCPPRPEGLIEGILKLQEKITGVRHPLPQNRHPKAPLKKVKGLRP